MSIIYHKNDIANWYELLLNAQSQTNISLDQEVEVYLAFMMNQSINDTSIVDSIIAMKYLEALKYSSSQQIRMLKTTAEYSLILSTLFPKVALKRNISMSYYSDMSQVAYNDLVVLCGNKAPQLCDLYSRVLACFNDIFSVLVAFRSIGNIEKNKEFENSVLNFMDRNDAFNHGLIN